ncbi:MAG: HK97 gp10 family phage protein [Ruminiclostridium sp.]|jgi:phage gpG-like protein|nr:HK97 gp10 family phage protein [Ruminiclostridium sp.]
MADSMHIEIIDNSAQVKEELKSAAVRALEMCGLTAEGYAKQMCPVNTGNLRNSITHQVDAEEPAAYIGSAVEYAPCVELGTGKYYPGGRQTPWVYEDAFGNWHLTHGQRAQPYLKPAVADHAQQYHSIIEEALRRG